MCGLLALGPRLTRTRHETRKDRTDTDRTYQCCSNLNNTWARRIIRVSSIAKDAAISSIIIGERRCARFFISIYLYNIFTGDAIPQFLI